MTASKHLRSHWRAATDAEVARGQDAARCSVSAFADVTAASGSLLQDWIQGREVLEFEHHPPDDVVDRRSGSQFYYHAHRDGDQEHGHLHLFWHATSTGRRRYLRTDRARWVRTAPTHLLAISLDAHGLPTALFTVNRWVTEGHWFDADTTMSFVARFSMDEIEGHETSCRWLTGFVRLYRPVIESLLAQRDERLARRPDPVRALEERRLEVLSHTPIDWAADLDSLEAEATRRVSHRGASRSNPL